MRKLIVRVLVIIFMLILNIYNFKYAEAINRTPKIFKKDIFENILLEYRKDPYAFKDKYLEDPDGFIKKLFMIYKEVFRVQGDMFYRYNIINAVNIVKNVNDVESGEMSLAVNTYYEHGYREIASFSIFKNFVITDNTDVTFNINFANRLSSLYYTISENKSKDFSFLFRQGSEFFTYRLLFNVAKEISDDLDMKLESNTKTINLGYGITLPIMKILDVNMDVIHNIFTLEDSEYAHVNIKGYKSKSLLIIPSAKLKIFNIKEEIFETKFSITAQYTKLKILTSNKKKYATFKYGFDLDLYLQEKLSISLSMFNNHVGNFKYTDTKLTFKYIFSHE